MIKKTISFLMLSLIIVFIYPAVESYNFKNGLNKSYANEWLNLYVLPNYDTSKIEQVNSEQSYSIEYTIGESFDIEDKDVEAVIDSEFGGEFNIINKDGIFHILLVNDGEITGLYTNNEEVSIDSINIQGMDRDSIRKIYENPVKTVDKGSKHLIVENEEYDVFDINDKYVYFFYYVYEEDKVNGLLTVKKSEMSHSDSMYNHPPEEDNEILNHHLINATREKYDVAPLEHDPAVSEAAAGHSKDMADKDYFSHSAPDGSALKHRIEALDISYRLAGENIAMGHTSPIFSHHSLMNSKEHRVNTLNDSYTHMGIGVDYNADEVPYYTENYIKK